jgi:hypothetical protein
MLQAYARRSGALFALALLALLLMPSSALAVERRNPENGKCGEFQVTVSATRLDDGRHRGYITVLSPHRPQSAQGEFYRQGKVIARFNGEFTSYGVIDAEGDPRHGWGVYTIFSVEAFGGSVKNIVARVTVELAFCTKKLYGSVPINVV